MAASMEGVGLVVTSPVEYQLSSGIVRRGTGRAIGKEGILRKSKAAEPGADQSVEVADLPLLPLEWPFIVFRRWTIPSCASFTDVYIV